MAETVTEFKVTYTDSVAGRLAIVTMDNGHDYSKPNTFGEGGLRSLTAALDEIESQTDVKGLLLTGKQFIFAVGADLTAFAGITPERAREAGAAGHAAFARLAALPFPTLAAINGACMGGGFEIALHCNARTVSSAAAALAFPEVFLSIFPAWGGTQLAPRVAGAANALKAIVEYPLNNNRMMKPREAFELGFADRLISGVDFLEQSLQVLEGMVTGDVTFDRPGGAEQADIDEVFATARRLAEDRVHGATRAPAVAIDLIEFAARGGELEEGRRREQDLLAELVPARQAQAAVYAFELTQQRAKRQPWKPKVGGRPIRQIAVVGAGLMGWQLGSLFLQRFEVPLVMKDIDESVLARARESIEGELDRRVQRGRLAPGRAAFLKSVVTYTTDDADLAGTDLAIEAVVEVMGLKQRIFADLERVVSQECVLATNTSSLSVAEMARDLAHPERVVGLHFFNPVAVLPLVEVVRTEHADDVTMATAFETVKTLKKTAVQCADAPAFVVNRLLTRFMGACGEAVNRGSSFREVDTAIKELGLPMGPFELLGLVGLRVAAHVAETMHLAFPDRFGLDENFQMLGESGLPGVYDWSSGGEPYAEIAERWQRDTTAEAQPTPDEIRQHALEAVADEAKHMLDEGVVADARDIDTCMLLGAGWPFFNGGICKYLDQVGISEKLFGALLVNETDAAA